MLRYKQAERLIILVENGHTEDTRLFECLGVIETFQFQIQPIAYRLARFEAIYKLDLVLL